MKFIALSTVVASLFTVALATSLEANLCTVNVDAEPTYIGADNNVLVQTASCPPIVSESSAAPAVFRPGGSLQARQTNVCGSPCATNCFAGAADAPTTGDCTVISNAILYASENVGALFTVGPLGQTNNTIVMTFRTCQTYYLNQTPADQTYCRTAWSDLVAWLSTECGSAKSRHGGNCVASNQAWYVQVQKKP